MKKQTAIGFLLGALIGFGSLLVPACGIDMSSQGGGGRYQLGEGKLVIDTGTGEVWLVQGHPWVSLGKPPQPSQ